jgi:hypothetical protein
MALVTPHPFNEVPVTGSALSVATGVAGVIRAPFRGVVNLVGVMVGSVVATADATCTTSIAGTAVTGGVLTVTTASSAIGDKFEAVPTGANTCNEGDVIKYAFTGSGTAGGHVHCYAVIRKT